MFIKPGHTMVVLNALRDILRTIGEIPENVNILTSWFQAQISFSSLQVPG
jgi:hypothetical protein